MREVVTRAQRRRDARGGDGARGRRWTSSSWRPRSPTTRRSSAPGRRCAKDGDTLTLVLKRTPDILGDLGPAARGDGRRAAARRLCRRDRGRRRARDGEARAEARRPHRRQRRVAAGRRLRRRHQRGHDHRRRPARRRCRCSRRRAWRRRSSIASKSCSRTVRLAPDVLAGPESVAWIAISSTNICSSPPSSASTGVSRDAAWRTRADRSGQTPGHDPGRPSSPQTSAELTAPLTFSSECRRGARRHPRRHRRLHPLQAAHARPHADRLRRRQPRRRSDVRRRSAGRRRRRAGRSRSSAAPASC